MAAAITWTNDTLDRLTAGGRWCVPRSGMVITVTDHGAKLCEVQPGVVPDPSILRVLKAAGWTWPPEGYTADELERDNPYNQWMHE